PWENEFARWLLLLPAHEDAHLTHTLEDIAMKQDPMLQKAIHKWENMSQNSSFRLAYEAREKVLFDEQAKLAHAREAGIDEVVRKAAFNKPVLAICVGMQALLQSSEENGGVDALGIFDGVVKHFPQMEGLKVPHIG
ncbi:PD-(D/E)XK nuclease family transposase, partial [Bacillus sp. B-TM1]